MAFHKIDLQGWARKEYYDHYFSAVPCTYSMTVKLDITALRRQGVKLYPAMLYALATVVNRHEEFRTALNEAGEPGIYDRMLPCYTVFHRDSETFSNIWTEYDPDFTRFLHHYEQDLQTYGSLPGMEPKPHTPGTPFPFPWCPGLPLKGSTSICATGTTICCPSSPWAATIPSRTAACCPWPCRYTTPSATGSTFAGL